MVPTDKSVEVQGKEIGRKTLIFIIIGGVFTFLVSVPKAIFTLLLS